MTLQVTLGSPGDTRRITAAASLAPGSRGSGDSGDRAPNRARRSRRTTPLVDDAEQPRCAVHAEVRVMEVLGGRVPPAMTADPIGTRPLPARFLDQRCHENERLV